MPGAIGAGEFFSGRSTTAASVVKKVEATDAAFWRWICCHWKMRNWAMSMTISHKPTKVLLADVRKKLRDIDRGKKV